MNSTQVTGSGNYDRATAVIQEARICLLAGARIKDSADPTDALLVLLSGPLSELHGQVFIGAELAKIVKKSFGWEITSEAIEFFVPKMRQLGWLQSGPGMPAKGPLYVNLPEPETESGGNLDTRAALETIGTEFQSFAAALSPFQTLPSDPLEAGATLLRHVVDANLVISVHTSKARSDEAFLAARFVEEVNKQKLPAREVLASLSAVGFLFRVADEIAHPCSRRGIDLRIIIDGPILLDFLGCSGSLRADASGDIFDRLREMGASTATFEHCVAEAREALRSVLRTAPRDRYGPTGEALRKGWVNENALLSLLQGFEIAVRAKGVDILPGDPDFLPNTEKFFSEELAKGVDEIINWHDDDNQDARYADSDTTVLTIRRRAGYRTTDLFTSKYVCVTTNEAFAGQTRRHLQEIAYYNSRQVPAVISLKELAAKLWFEIGNADSAARLALPNSQLLLSCDRALRFNRKVVDKARSELEKVRPDQLKQFELLLEVPRSARAVMDLTLNNESNVSGDTIEQLLEAAVQAAGSEVAAKAKEQRARDHEKFKKELTATEAMLTAERERANQNEEEVRRARERREATDTSMIQAAGERATQRFARRRSVIRALSIFVAVFPLVILAGLAWSGNAWPVEAAVAVLTSVLGSLAAMDRPGAWLSRIIQRRIAVGLERELKAVGRDDLGEHLELSWSDGIAIATVGDGAISK